MTRAERITALLDLAVEIEDMPAEDGVAVHVHLKVNYVRECARCGWKIITWSLPVPEKCDQCQGAGRPRRDEIAFDQTFRK